MEHIPNGVKKRGQRLIELTSFEPCVMQRLSVEAARIGVASCRPNDLWLYWPREKPSVS